MAPIPRAPLPHRAGLAERSLRVALILFIARRVLLFLVLLIFLVLLFLLLLPFFIAVLAGLRVILVPVLILILLVPFLTLRLLACAEGLLVLLLILRWDEGADEADRDADVVAPEVGIRSISPLAIRPVRYTSHS